MRWYRFRLGLSVALAAAMGGCAGADPPVRPIATVPECEASFSELDSALGGDPNIDVAAARLYTLRACSSREAWLTTAAQHDKVRQGQDSLEAVLDDLCQNADDPAELPACGSSAG